MKIPVIDFSIYDEETPETLDKLAEQVDSALSGIGFMSVANLGIDNTLREKVFAASKDFFASAPDLKNKLGYSGAKENFGYQGVCEEHLKPGAPPDLKEALTMRDIYSHRDADWPSNQFRDTVFEFYGQCFEGARKLGRVFARVLGVDNKFFLRAHSGSNVTLRMLHYPPVVAETIGQLGAGEHTDYGMLTLLFQDMEGGLEVYDKKEDIWQAVKPVEDAIVINTGDLMERWTNGRFLSTLHRVQTRAGQSDRYSIVVFFDPDDDVMIECLPSCHSSDNPAKYPPIKAGDHILGKISATHKEAQGM